MVKFDWDWNSTESKGNEDYKRLISGGYVCRITKAEDNSEKQYIYMEFDISEGEFTGYGASCLERNGFTPLKMFRSYTDKAAGMFKGFVECLNQSNPNSPAWDFDEAHLVGKWIGIVLGEEEYKKQDGTIKTRFYVKRTVIPASIRSGNFKVPDLKKLPVEQNTAAFTPMDDDDGDLPF